MKSTKRVLALLLVFGLVIGTVGCFYHPSNKTTGGGSFTDNQTGNRVTFGFTAQPTEDGMAKGKFQLVDHDTKTRVHGTFSVAVDVQSPEYVSRYEGTCLVDGQGHNLVVDFLDLGEPGADAGDGVVVYIDEALTYAGVLDRGNIQNHEAKE